MHLFAVPLWLECKALHVTIWTSNLSINDPHTSGLNQIPLKINLTHLDFKRFFKSNYKLWVGTLSKIVIAMQSFVHDNLDFKSINKWSAHIWLKPNSPKNQPGKFWKNLFSLENLFFTYLTVCSVKNHTKPSSVLWLFYRFFEELLFHIANLSCQNL